MAWPPKPAFASSQVACRATVKSQGTAPTPSGVVLGVGFSIDGGPNVTWSSGYTTALAPGASVTLAADGGPTGQSTWTATAGPHTLTATADDVNRFPESNEGNNSLMVSLPISFGPPKIGRSTAATNGPVSFTFTATTGLLYRVQYKNDLPNALRTTLGSDILSSSNSIPVSDNLTGVPKRFYRALQVN